MPHKLEPEDFEPYYQQDGLCGPGWYFSDGVEQIGPSKTEFLCLLDSAERKLLFNAPDFQTYLVQVASMKQRFTTTIVQLASHLEIYADIHKATYEWPIAQDAVLGPAWEDMCEGLLTLLNGESGNLDCGRMDTSIRRLMREHGSKRAAAQPERAETYRVVRSFVAHGRASNEVIHTGLTLEEAQRHCKDLQTSSRTCSTVEAVAITRHMGEWFDMYEQE